MRKFYKSLLLTTFITSLGVLPPTYSYAGGKKEDTACETTKSSTVPLAAPPRLEEGRKLAADLLENGYFVHLARVDLLNPKTPQTNLKLIGGAVTPLNFDRERALLYVAFVKASRKPTLEQLKAVSDVEQHIATHGDAAVTYVPNPDSFRPCIYFSLHGPLTTSHDKFDVEHRTQAVLIPTKYLLPDVVNLYPSDTAVWRSEIDLREIEGARLFLPESSVVPPDLNLGHLQVERYSGSLPKAVSVWLETNTGRCLKFVDAPELKDSLLDKALLEDHDLTDPSFFEEFLTDHPHASFGHEAVVKRTGIGLMISYLHGFVEEFARLYRYGMCKKNVLTPPKVVKRYRVESIVVFAEHLLDLLEKNLIEWGNESVLKDFHEKQAPKARLAIANLKRYVEQNKGVDTYKNRAHTFEIALEMAQHPYAWAKTVLEDAAFNEVREEFETTYWAMRVSKQSLGVIPVDEHDPLKKLSEAALKLRTKITSKEPDFSYVQLTNCIFQLPLTRPETKESRAHYSELVKALMPALPANGRISIQTGSGTNGFNFKETLNSHRISISKSEWDRGITSMPAFKTKRSLENML